MRNPHLAIRNSMKALHVVGARPNFMKTAPIMEEMARYPERFQQVLVHTGQHYDDEMSQVFSDDLGIPRPDVYLGVGSGSHEEQGSRGAEVRRSGSDTEPRGTGGLQVGG